MCTFSQITNVILVVSAEDVCVCMCMCTFVCFSGSHITNIILVVGSGDECVFVWVCVPLDLRTPHEFK